MGWVQGMEWKGADRSGREGFVDGTGKERRGWEWIGRVQGLDWIGMGGKGKDGLLAWMFHRKGSFVVSSDSADEETLIQIALEAGADDVNSEGELFEIVCDTGAFSVVKAALANKEIETVSAALAMIPANTVTVSGANDSRKVLRLMEALEENDDVQNVYANFDIPDEIMADVEKEQS